VKTLRQLKIPYDDKSLIGERRKKLKAMKADYNKDNKSIVYYIVPYCMFVYRAFSKHNHEAQQGGCIDLNLVVLV